MEKMNKNEQGFTLIELIIVVVILGILAAVGIPKFMNSRLEAWASTCRSNRASLDDAVERFRFDNSTLPTASGFQAALVSGDYIKTEFTCPATNTSTVYEMTTGTGVVTCTNTGTASLSDKKHAAQ
jgi:type IV pilus assembly protein PilA